MKITNSSPESICILRLSAIGDVCNAIATVQAIQAHDPEIKITWIVGKIEANLLSLLSPSIKPKALWLYVKLNNGWQLDVLTYY